MTLEEVRKLTRDEKRIRVANIRGWEKVEEQSSPWNNVWKLNGKIQKEPPPLYAVRVEPMLEIEREFLTTTNLQARYINTLKEVSFDPSWMLADGWAVFATAEQRAEAFILVMTEL